jgi:hypothetical protein
LKRFLAIAALLLALAPGASAEEVLTTPHFRFVADSGSIGLAQRLAGIAEGRRRVVLGILGFDDSRMLEVRVASSEEAMQEMVGASKPIKEWVAGMAMSSRNLIVMSARGNEVFHAVDTFLHELAHIYLDGYLEGRRVPRWFHEGFAMLVATEQVGERLKNVMGAAATGSFMPMSELTDSFPRDPPTVHLAYAQSQVFVRFLQRRSDGTGVRELLAQVRAGMPFDMAFMSVFGGSVEALWAEYESSLDPVSSILVFLVSATMIWLLITLLFLWVYSRKRAKAARKREMWALQEELERIRQMGESDEVQ